MKIDTELVKKYVPCGMLSSRRRQHEPEYRALAILRYFFSDCYNSAILTERPDIQTDNVGIEVTTLEKAEVHLASNKFAEYCSIDNKDGCEVSRYEVDNNRIVKTPVGYVLESGGGISDDNDFNFHNTIFKKIQKMNEYENANNRVMGLAIIQTEIPPIECEDKCSQWIKEALSCRANNIAVVYVISNRYLLLIDLKAGTEKKYNISKNVNEKINKIVRMTVEDILNLESEEWN